MLHALHTVPPKITPFEFARDVNVGDRVSVQCVVGTGDLPLTFRWLKDDQPFIAPAGEKSANRKAFPMDVDSPVMIRQNDEFTSALSISAITRNQGGQYKCIVENDAATETYSALLRVNGKIMKQKPINGLTPPISPRFFRSMGEKRCRGMKRSHQTLGIIQS